MKKLIAFVLTVILSSCLISCSGIGGQGKASSENGLDSQFQAVISITLDELNAEGTLKRFGSGSWEVEFSSPNTLSGIKLSFSEGNTSASYKGLNFSVPQSALPVKSMMLNLITAVDDLAKNEELSGNETDGGLQIEGSLDGGEYTLTVDKNGNISSFAMPGNKLSISFSDVTPISGSAPSEASTESQTSEEAPTNIPTAETTAA